jgi:hypothetical protein
MEISIDPLFVDSIRLHFRMYEKLRRRSMSDLKGMREDLFKVAAEVTQKYIQAQVASGREFVTYYDLRELLGIDRRVVDQVLFKLQELNTASGGPLWCVFVGYKGIGGPGGGFFTTAKKVGWNWECHEEGFLSMMRGLCRRALGVDNNVTV